MLWFDSFLKSQNGEAYPKREECQTLWYVIQVNTGKEENICAQCKQNISSDVLQDCFVPRYEESRKINGTRTKRSRILFPGYVFLVTEDVKALFELLKTVSGMTKLLGVGDDIVPITSKEEGFLRRFITKTEDEAIVEMSTGIIEGERVIVTEGPLMGLEGYIRKIDRHKRMAWLELEMFGQLQHLKLGLEVVEVRKQE